MQNDTSDKASQYSKQAPLPQTVPYKRCRCCASAIVHEQPYYIWTPTHEQWAKGAMALVVCEWCHKRDTE